MELIGFFEAGGVDGSGADAVFFYSGPAVGAGLSVFIETILASLSPAEGVHGGELSLDAIEEMEDGVPLGGEIQFCVDGQVDVTVNRDDGDLGKIHGDLLAGYVCLSKGGAG